MCCNFASESKTHISILTFHHRFQYTRELSQVQQHAGPTLPGRETSAYVITNHIITARIIPKHVTTNHIITKRVETNHIL